tara:strand:- start:2105 stop:2503 length:399 start_codon:yes stop_codon:yes gene_type:complete
MEGMGPLLPLARDPSFGPYVLITSYEDEIRQNFKNLLLTSPGERMMNTDFGVGLRRYLFENYTEARYAIKQRIESQVKRYMPYIVVHDILFDTTGNDEVPLEDRSILSIRVSFSVPDLNLETTIIVDHEALA